MLLEGDLGWMREMQAGAMPFTCTVSTPGSPTRDAYDEEVAGSPTGVEVACGVRRASGREVLAGGGVASAGDAVIVVPFGTNVPNNATIRRHATADDIERIYQVKDALAGGSYQTALEVLATEIK